MPYVKTATKFLKIKKSAIIIKYIFINYDLLMISLNCMRGRHMIALGELDMVRFMKYLLCVNKSKIN